MSRRDRMLGWTEEDEKAFAKAFRKGTPRYVRAKRFSDDIVHVLDDFLPQDHECRRIVLDYLIQLSFKTNACVINVPPEWDALDKLAIEKAMQEGR